ncbi:MAG TPA: DUF898 family protein, partial [Nitrospiria bacterium]
MIGTVRCPKCNYTQMSASTCKSCGKEIDIADSSGMFPQSDVLATSVAFSEPTASSGDGAGELSSGAAAVSTDEASPEDETALTGGLGGLDEAPGITASEDDGGSRQPFFFGAGGTLFGIHIVNLFLTVLTLGLFFFWAKVRVRKYTYSQTEFEGDRFAYHGSGKELLIGFIKGGIVFGAVSAIMNFAPMIPGGTAVKAAVWLIGYFLLLALIPFAIVGAHRYRMTRTSWRGIRFSFRRPAKEYIKTFLKDILLTGFTLGLYYPFFSTHKYSFLANETYFGSRKFEFDGQGKDLFKTFIITVLLIPFTAGWSWFWYRAKQQRYFWEHTTFGKARF